MLGLILYLFLGFIMHQTRGLYHPGGVLGLAAAVAGLAGVFLKGGAAGWGRASGRVCRLVLLLGLAASCALLFFQPSLVYVRMVGWLPSFTLALAAAVAGSFLGIAHELAPKAGLARASWMGLIVVGIALVAARVFVILIAPVASIDVWVYNSMGCDYLAAGKNPYSILYPDIYHGKWPYSPYNCYPPGYLLCALPFKICLGDVRYAHVFGDLVAAVSLCLLARKQAVSERNSLLLGLVWLAAPVSLYIINQSLVDPMVSTWTGLFFLAMAWRRWFFAAVALGILCTIKQYAFVIGLGTLPWLVANVPRRQWLSSCAVVAGTAAVIVLPFALTDWPGFFTSVIQTVAKFPLRLDASNLNSFIANEFEFRLPSFVSSGLTLISLSGGLWWLWKRPVLRLADAAGYVVLCFGVIFLFGPQASCNYYHLLSYFILLALALNGSATRRDNAADLAA